MKIEIEINNLTKTRINKKFLEKVAEKTLKILKIKMTELSLAIIGEARMKELNRKYRQRNRATDVLAFDYGEIFICLPQAKKQAKQLGHSLNKELGILLIHGLLHIAGYDDETKKDYNKMVKKQEQLWLKIIS